MTFVQFSLALALVLPLTCGSGSNSDSITSGPVAQNFNDYWFQGKAEITSYHLQQARYGEIHEGSAVLIFVTEPFSKKKQVKLDYTEGGDPDRIDVLKLNSTRKFNTGIYPYSMMNSVFYPLDESNPHALKTTTTSQEWCGHTFLQMNRHSDHYDVSLRSYFESEGDSDTQVELAWLEDELWTLLRIDPNKLPVGQFEIIPSSFYTRLMHKEVKPYGATASLTDCGDQLCYELSIADLGRSLIVFIEPQMPHRIDGWEEEYKSGYGSSAKMLTTRAKLNKRLMSDYWNQNSNSDSEMRRSLGL